MWYPYLRDHRYREKNSELGKVLKLQRDIEYNEAGLKTDKEKAAQSILDSTDTMKAGIEAQWKMVSLEFALVEQQEILDDLESL